jgi:wobble nucleotide-excising tRNase
MIEKFVTIKNIGRFRDCNPRGDVAFRKLTLLFAENGRGKTTLCAVLRSLQIGQPEIIAERKTLGTTSPASVHVRIDGNDFTFGNNAWSANYPDIAIFDSVFVHENVYAGDYVDHDHKKNLYRVIVGSQGAQLAKKIDVLDDRIRNANIAIRTKKDAASRMLPNGVTLDDYLAWQSVADIDNHIQQKSTEITNRQRTLEKATEIQSKGFLTKIALPELPSDFVTILGKELADITADAETRVRQQVATCCMGNHGETWLSQGLGFVTGNKCPFCGQGISDNDLIAAYRAHFSTGYKALKLEVAQLRERINRSIGESGLSTAQKTLSSNLTLLEFWKQFAPMILFDFAFEDISVKYAKLCDLALEFAQRKEQSPTEPVIPDASFHAASEEVKSLQQSVQSYNAAIDKCNLSINAQKSAVQQGVDINALKRELANLEAKKKRFEPDVVQACKEYRDELNAKTALEQQKTTAKEHLDLYCQNILQSYESAINLYLDQFNTGFRITNCRHQYTGGTPSSQYQLQINNCAINLGDSRTQQGTHCFKTTLSSGDRSALAFAFFLAAMKQDLNIAKKILVLDDPFTSQDRFRRTCTQQLIRQLADSAKQVVVLSHDPHFLRLIWEGLPSGDVKVLQMCRTGDNTIMGECDIEAETQSTYLRDYSALLDFYRERKGAALAVARSIRPFLEGLLRAHFPGRFKPNEWLGDFINRIRDASDTDGLSHAKADLPEIETINDYSRKYHHDQNPRADSEFLSPDELHGYVKRTLRLVGGC